MSRSATCPKCGGRITVPNGYAGTHIACPECGATFRLCAPSPKVRPATPPPPPVTTDDDFATDATGAPLYPCGMCGGSFPPERVYDANGLVLCHDCYARSIAPAPEAASRLDEFGPSPPPSAATTRPIRWLVPVGIAVVVVVAAGVILSGALHTKPATRVASAESTRVKLRDFSTLTATRKETKESKEPKEPPSVARQIDAAWQEAKAAAGRDDFTAADAKYRQVFDLLESQAGQPAYRSLAGDLVGARREWDAVRGRLGTLAPPSSPTTAPTSPPPAVATGPQAGNDASAAVPTVRTSRRARRKALDEAKVLERLTAAGKAARAGQKLNAAVLYKQAYDLLGGAGDEARSDALQTALVNAAATRKALLAEIKELPETRDLALSALLARGNAALATANWQAALEALADARQMVEEQTKVPERAHDDRYLQALHGMAVAYLRLNDVPRAGDLFDDRSPLGRAVKEKLDARRRDSAAAGRDLVYNRAVVDMIQKFNVMRAVRGVKDYLAAQDKAAPVDQEMLDLLGTAMYLANESGRAGGGNRLMKEAESLYAEQLKRLEATRPGKRRWGAEWLPAGEVAKLVAEKQRAMAAVQTAQRDLDAAQRQLATAKKGHLPRGGVGMQFFVVDPAEVSAAEGMVKGAKERLAIAKAAVPREPWKPRPEPTLPAAAYAMARPPPQPVAPQEAVAAGPAPTTPIAPPDTAPTTTVEVVAAAPPRVQRNAIAFAVDPTRLVTAADVVGEAESVRLEDVDGGSFRTRVVTKQGLLALLEVNAKDLNGGRLPALALAADFRGGPVRCASIPSASLFLPSVELLGGTATPPPAQGGWQVSLERHPRLPGAPLLDGSGKVVGVVTARRDAPPTQLPAATLAELRAFLQGAGALAASPSGGADPSRVFHVIAEQ